MQPYLIFYSAMKSFWILLLEREDRKIKLEHNMLKSVVFDKSVSNVVYAIATLNVWSLVTPMNHNI